MLDLDGRGAAERVRVLCDDVLYDSRESDEGGSYERSPQLIAIDGPGVTNDTMQFPVVGSDPVRRG